MEHSRDSIFVAGQSKQHFNEQKKVPILFLEADGIMVRLQRSNGKNLELKMGIAYEGWEVNGKNRKLKNPVVMAGVFQGGEAFWETFSAHLSELYDLSETVICISGDGASWIQQTAKDYFSQAIVQLDRFHLIRDLRFVLGTEKTNKLLKVLNSKQLDAFVNTLESLEPEIKENKRKLYTKLLNFCKNYRTHLLDYRQQLGEQAKRFDLSGMGIAETMVDKKIANRMKKRGMRWSKSGAWAMAALLMLRSNGQLFQWLEEHGDEDIVNPIKKLAQRVKETSSSNPIMWKNISVPGLNVATRPWTEALKELSGF